MRKVLYILGQLTDDDAEWLAGAGRRERIGPGTELIRRGTRLQDLYIVLEGELAVRAGDSEIAKVGVGDILGEMSFVDDSPTSASVVALSAATVLAVPRSAIQARLDQDTAFAARLYKAIAIFLADRMRKTMGRFGYAPVADEDGALAEDELDSHVLDGVYLAGSRFDRMLRRLLG